MNLWILRHSQTRTGNGDETYNANNTPKEWPGGPGNGESWKWDTSPAGDWGIQIWQGFPDGGYTPIIIIVFDKP